MRKRNYILRPEKEYIKLELTNGAGIDYLTPDRDFLNILSNETWHMTLFNNDGRLMAEYWTGRWNTRTRSRVYLYDLAYACYCGMAHAETFEDDLQKYSDWKNAQGLTIDHLDGNVHNNTILNLSLMPLSINISKKTFPAGFVPPYTMSMAYVSGEYRIQMILENTELDVVQRMLNREVSGRFTLNDGAGTSMLSFICEDAESMAACLKWLYDLSFEWCNPGESVRGYKRMHKDVPYMAADIQKSLLAQKTLAQMDRAKFQVFNSDK